MFLLHLQAVNIDVPRKQLIVRAPSLAEVHFQIFINGGCLSTCNLAGKTFWIPPSPSNFSVCKKSFFWCSKHLFCITRHNLGNLKPYSSWPVAVQEDLPLCQQRFWCCGEIFSFPDLSRTARDLSSGGVCESSSLSSRASVCGAAGARCFGCFHNLFVAASVSVH